MAVLPRPARYSYSTIHWTVPSSIRLLTNKIWYYNPSHHCLTSYCQMRCSIVNMYQNQTDHDSHLVFYYCRQKSSTFYFTDLLACNLMVWPSSFNILPYSISTSILPILGDVPKSNWWSLTPSFWGFWIEIINFLFYRPSF